MRYC
ncbi:unnamed protein product, partial [Didymodactylos carnosus]